MGKIVASKQKKTIWKRCSYDISGLQGSFHKGTRFHYRNISNLNEGIKRGLP